jgi:hypothetical protein
VNNLQSLAPNPSAQKYNPKGIAKNFENRIFAHLILEQKCQKPR